MLLSKNKKNNVYPCKPQFDYIKVEFKWVKIIKACFRDDAQSIIRAFARHSDMLLYRIILLVNM